MRRRDFIAGLASGASGAWLHAARAQQPATPVVGFLRHSTASGSEHLASALRSGLAESGFSEGQNVAVEYRWGDNHPERLANLAADLVRRHVAVIVASSGEAALAAKAATSTIPIVFVSTIDPVKAGLVTSMRRPGGNATGFSYLTSALAGKRLELLRQLVPGLKSVGVIARPESVTTAPLLGDLKAAAAALGLPVIVSEVDRKFDLENAFAVLVRQRVGGLIMGPDPTFTSRRAQIVALAARYALPAIYTTIEFARAGGLMSWGVNLTDQHRQAGAYAGKILKGAHPAELPVMQPTKYEFVLNLKAAKALNIDVPPMLLALVDEVIE